MTVPLIEIASSVSNFSVTYQELTGVTYFRHAEASYSTPSSLEVYSIVSVEKDPDAPFTPGRIQPAQLIRLSYLNTDGTYFIAFVGRIDTAEQVDSPNSDAVSLASLSGTRQWHITARDWLAVLADNYIQPGKWKSQGVLPTRGVPYAPTDAWIGNYVGNYTGTPAKANDPGETRFYIVADLVLNIVNNSTAGVDNKGNGLINCMGLAGEGANSKPIVKNLSNLTQTLIIDAIRDLLRCEPWNTASSGSQVDGYDIAAAGFPDTAGFGSEIHILDPNRTDLDSNAKLGRTVQYYKHGGVDSGFLYSYTPVVSSTSLVSIISRYRFNRQGLDLFSRSRPSGQGDGTYNRPDQNDGGTGVNLPLMESVWDPLNGNFAKRAEAPAFSDSMIGDWMYEEQRTNPYDAIQAREQRDSAYADLVSGGSALAQLRGGLNQGQITIAGPPLNSNGAAYFNGLPVPIVHQLRPGETIDVVIEPLGITPANDNSVYIAQLWSYEWPADETTITVARLPFSALGKQLIDIQRRVNESITAHGKMFISQWISVDHSGQMQWQHNMGTKPGSVVLEVAHWDGTTHIAGSTTIPLPTSDTHVVAPATTWDASQGQNYGYVVGKATEQSVTVYLGYFLAYSDGSGWMKRDDPNTLCRLKVYPT